MAEIVYTRSSLKELMRIGAVERARVVAKLEQYAREPASLANQVKALKGSASFRLRVGDYRVIFAADGERIVILKAGHRRDVYE
jgi:mRNA interferase RelE/StbE